MGWTSGFATRQEAIDSEFCGMTIHYQKGAWIVASNTARPDLGPMIYHILWENGAIKCVELTMGPLRHPPIDAVECYFDNGGTYEAAGKYGEPMLRKVRGDE